MNLCCHRHPGFAFILISGSFALFGKRNLTPSQRKGFFLPRLPDVKPIPLMFSTIIGCGNSKQHVFSHYSKTQRIILFLVHWTWWLYYYSILTSENGNKTFLGLWKNYYFQCTCEVGHGREDCEKGKRISLKKVMDKSKLLAFSRIKRKQPSIILVKTLRDSLFLQPLDHDFSFCALCKT